MRTAGMTPAAPLVGTVTTLPGASFLIKPQGKATDPFGNIGKGITLILMVFHPAFNHGVYTRCPHK